MLKNSLKSLWALLSVVILCITLYTYDPEVGSDSGIFLVYGMLILAFPSSLVVAGLVTTLVLLQETINVPILDLIGNTHLGFVFLWFLFFLCGYYQWFKFLPWCWRKWLNRGQ